MSDIKFDCPACRKSFEASSDMAGQLIDCPSCKKTIEIPIARPIPKVQPKPSPLRPAPQPRSTLSAPVTQDSVPASSTRTNPLPRILVVLVVIAVMVGAFFAYSFWKDQQRAKANAERARIETQKKDAKAKADAERARLEAQKAEAKAKAEAPFFVAAKDALDEAHKMQSALGVGLSYQKYGDQLIVLATKVDNLLRAAMETGIPNLNPDARVFCQKLDEARERFKHARSWWDLKIEFPDSPRADELEKSLQDDWSKASKAIDEADRVYARLKN